MIGAIIGLCVGAALAAPIAYQVGRVVERRRTAPRAPSSPEVGAARPTTRNPSARPSQR